MYAFIFNVGMDYLNSKKSRHVLKIVGQRGWDVFLWSEKYRFSKKLVTFGLKCDRDMFYSDDNQMINAKHHLLSV